MAVKKITPPNRDSYNPEKHKGYILLYKRHGSPIWVPGNKVASFRSQGYKTETDILKEVEKYKRKMGIVDVPANIVDRHPETGEQLDTE